MVGACAKGQTAGAVLVGGGEDHAGAGGRSRGGAIWRAGSRSAGLETRALRVRTSATDGAGPIAAMDSEPGRRRGAGQIGLMEMSAVSGSPRALWSTAIGVALDDAASAARAGRMRWCTAEVDRPVALPRSVYDMRPSAAAAGRWRGRGPPRQAIPGRPPTVPVPTTHRPVASPVPAVAEPRPSQAPAGVRDVSERPMTMR